MGGREGKEKDEYDVGAIMTLHSEKMKANKLMKDSVKVVPVLYTDPQIRRCVTQL